MQFRTSIILSFLFICSFAEQLVSAPINDDCSKAYQLNNVSNYCSSPRQFTNFGATPSGFPNPGCFPSYLLEPDNDVWFRFTAVATSVNISVIGAIAGDPKGTLESPQFALYRGSCKQGLLEVACMSDARGYNIVETFVHSLVIGETYYLRIDGRNGSTGTFQLCVNNFNPVPSPSSDCSTAVVLCDKSPFTVPNVVGAGLHQDELLPGLCIREESSSAWYKWTCDQPGTLTMTLQPVNPADDIDFLLFFLPNGVEDCDFKIPVRCMASGEEVGASFSNWSRCSGATGLRSTSEDVVEEPGCQPTDDNFVAALEMRPGESYALMVNNFHNTGNGFSITFGGSGTFRGPVAHFVVNKLSIQQDKTLWVRNKSTFDGGIVQWEWNFGVGATPQTARGEGPHQVKYSSAGSKSISLSIETGNGCQVTKVRTIQVKPAPAEPPEVLAEQTPSKQDQEEGVPSEEVLLPEDQKQPGESGPSLEASVNGSVISNEDASTEEVEEPEMSLPAGGENASDTIQESITYKIDYQATIYFQSDSATLDRDDEEILRQVIELLQKNHEQLVIVEGHTNNIPSDEYCNQLSAKRADVVIQWLRDHGVEEPRIVRKVMGKKKLKNQEPQFQSRKFYQKAVVKLGRRESRQ